MQHQYIVESSLQMRGQSPMNYPISDVKGVGTEHNLQSYD